jgi:hypothetical protein
LEAHVTIHPRPDQEVKIREALQAGLIKSAEDVIDAGLEHLRDRISSRMSEAAGNAARPESLVEFFRRSPLVGLELDLERDKDIGRDIEL